MRDTSTERHSERNTQGCAHTACTQRRSGPCPLLLAAQSRSQPPPSPAHSHHLSGLSHALPRREGHLHLLTRRPGSPSPSTCAHLPISLPCPAPDASGGSFSSLIPPALSTPLIIIRLKFSVSTSRAAPPPHPSQLLPSGLRPATFSYLSPNRSRSRASSHSPSTRCSEARFSVLTSSGERASPCLP